MLQHLNLTMIGGGAMAEALLAGLLSRKLLSPAQVVVTDPLETRRAYLSHKFGVLTSADNIESVKQAHLVLLAVKPQVLGRVLAELNGKIPEHALIISIVAGVPTQTILNELAHTRVVRAMPNTPAQIGQGVSVWYATPAVTTEQRQISSAFLGAVGTQLPVIEEKYLDMATALSGSGPAYVFLFLEALIDAGVQIGFARPVAEQLATQTLAGAVAYAQQSNQHPAVLRNQVTSPAGTTAAGLLALEQGAFRAVVQNCVQAAYQRALELGK